ncbi:MAG: hypothetical protein ACM3PA_01130 [Methanomassiliicoccales archaeon]
MIRSWLSFLAQIKTSLLNSRQGRLIAIVAITTIFLSGLLWLLLSGPTPKPLPSPTPSPKITKAPAEDYLICVARQQMTTGYTEPSWGPPASSGAGYFVGSIAVHPRVATQWNGDPRNPIIPFGTAIHFINPSSVKINDTWYDTLIVNDTGDTNLGLWSAYPYWLDLYFGPTATWSNQSARAYGTNKVDFYWVEKWH